MPSYKQFVDQENHKKVNHIIEPLPYYVKVFSTIYTTRLPEHGWLMPTTSGIS